MNRVDIIGLEWASNGPRIGLEWALDWTCILLSHPLLQVHTPKRLQILSLKKLSRNWTELTSLASNWPRVGNELDLYLAQSATAPGSPNRLQIYSLKKHSRNWTELATLASNWPCIGHKLDLYLAQSAAAPTTQKSLQIYSQVRVPVMFNSRIFPKSGKRKD